MSSGHAAACSDEASNNVAASSDEGASRVAGVGVGGQARAGASGGSGAGQDVRAGTPERRSVAEGERRGIEEEALAVLDQGSPVCLHAKDLACV